MFFGNPGRTRWLGGTVLLALMVVILTGCDVSVGWKSTRHSSTTGRSAETFAPACSEIGGTLVEVETVQEGAQSVCTVANGDKITCDWTAERCVVECFTSDDACAATVEFMGYVPPPLPRTSVPATPVPADSALGGPSSPHPANAAWS